MSPTKIDHVDSMEYKNTFKGIINKNDQLKRCACSANQLLKNSYFNPINHQYYDHTQNDQRHSTVKLKWSRGNETEVPLNQTVKWAGSMVNGNGLASNRFNKKKTDVNLWYNA